MQISSRNARIIAAVVIAAAMIGVSFWLTSAKPRLASALSTDELLRAYVEQDTDQDGLPDWQEEVYGTDPANPSSVEAGMTDAEAVARGYVDPAFLSEPAPEPITDKDIPVPTPADTSLTAQFSHQFIEEYFAAGGGKNVSEEEQAKIIENLIATFSREAEARLDSAYTRVSLQVRADADAMTYAGALEAMLQSSLPTENSDMPGLANALIERGDAKAGNRLLELARVYGSLATKLLALPVPSELADEHLMLVRAYDRVSKAGSVLSRYEEDPVSALGALSVFVPARDDIISATKGIAESILAEGEPETGEPGALLVEFVRAQERQ